MALIYRSVLEVQDEDAIARAPELFQDWLGVKFTEPPSLDGPDRQTIHPFDDHDAAELRVRTLRAAGVTAYEARLFERWPLIEQYWKPRGRAASESVTPSRGGMRLATTFRMFAADHAGRWATVDLERWMDSPFDPVWEPTRPLLVSFLLERLRCCRGGLRMDAVPREATRAQAEGVRRRIEESAALLPVVLVTRPSGRADGVQPLLAALERRLGGVAMLLYGEPDVLLAFDADPQSFGSEAVTVFTPLDGLLVPRMNVALGPELDDEWPATADRVAVPVLRAAVQVPPPRVYRETFRKLMAEPGEASELAAYAMEEADRMEKELAALQEENRELRERLRTDPDAGEAEPTSETSPELAFVDEIRRAYERDYSTLEQRDAWPWRDPRVGPQFMASLESLEGLSRERVVLACLDVVTGRAKHISGRQVHPLRQSAAGNSPQRSREDGAVAWRCAIQHGSPSARRVHWWALPDQRVELARVGKHDDMRI